MLSKEKIKFFSSLKLKKYREKHLLFTAEGYKTVSDMLKGGFEAEYIVKEKNFRKEIKTNAEIIEANISDIKRISSLNTPSEVLAVFKIKEKQVDYKLISENLIVFLDQIQDPGNLGTIIRTANWFGVKSIICRVGTVDIYNPKTVKACSGSIGNVDIHYIDGEEFFGNSEIKKLDVYGTFLEGENVYKTKFKNTGVIVIGNEGKGISPEIENHVTKKILIPSFSAKNKKPESLNASVAAALTIAEFKRQNID